MAENKGKLSFGEMGPTWGEARKMAEVCCGLITCLKKDILSVYVYTEMDSVNKFLVPRHSRH